MYTFNCCAQPNYEGLTIDPCFPKDWDGYEMTRKFRGKTYIIKDTNPDHVCKGVKSMTVNGEAVEGNNVPMDMGGDVVEVIVILG